MLRGRLAQAAATEAGALPHEPTRTETSAVETKVWVEALSGMKYVPAGTVTLMPWLVRFVIASEMF